MPVYVFPCTQAGTPVVTNVVGSFYSFLLFFFYYSFSHSYFFHYYPANIWEWHYKCVFALQGRPLASFLSESEKIQEKKKTMKKIKIKESIHQTIHKAEKTILIKERNKRKNVLIPLRSLATIKSKKKTYILVCTYTHIYNSEGGWLYNT